MTDWYALAAARFAKTGPGGTDETDERGGSSVLSVPPEAIFEKCAANDEDQETLFESLLDEAERVCDYWGDSPEAREEMRQEIMQVARDGWRELLQHFRQTYRR